MKRPLITTIGIILMVLGWHVAARPQPGSARKLIDILWVWGIPEGNGGYDTGKGPMLATADPGKFAQADPQSKAAILGVRNVVMAGDGLPNDLNRAERLSSGIAGLKRIRWEFMPDGGVGPPFVYTEKLAILKSLKARYPQIEGVSIDDMLTSQRNHGLRPQHIATLQSELKSNLPDVKMWAIVYTKNFNDPLLPEYLKILDGVNLWTWQADEIRDLDRNLTFIEKLAGGKPIMLGLYLYDYGQHRKMPRELMTLQCEKARALAKQGRIDGIIFLSVSNDPDTIIWTRDWIKRVGDEPLGHARHGVPTAAQH